MSTSELNSRALLGFIVHERQTHPPKKTKDSESLLYPITYVRVELYISV